MPMLNNPLKDLSKTKLNSNTYIGFVVNNVDADDKKHRQRAQIRIPQLHRNIADADLPWAIPDASQSTNNTQVSSGSQVGSVNIPPIGSKIYVRLDDNDPHNPRYAGSPSSDDVSKENELLKEDYPHSKGDINLANNRESFNLEKQTKMSTHPSGTTIHIDANGALSIAAASDVNIGAQGDINLVAKGNVNVWGSLIKLNEGSKSPASITKRERPQVATQSGKVTV